MNKMKLYVVAFVGVVVLGTIAFLATEHFRTKDFAPDLKKAAVVHVAQKQQEAASAKVDTVVKYLYVAEKTHKAKADSLRKLADDSTCNAPCLTTHDSLTYFQRHSGYLEQETIELRAALDTADARADSLLRDRDRWKAQAFKADSVNLRLQADVLKASGGCHILPFVRCPTRTEAAIGGALGAIAVIKYHSEITKAIRLAIPL